jgi:hypothetical protein
VYRAKLQKQRHVYVTAVRKKTQARNKKNEEKIESFPQVDTQFWTFSFFPSVFT